MQWGQKLDYIKNLKMFPKISFGLELKTKAYLGLLIYWVIILSAPFFTVELKVANGNKVRLSPHQVSFHFLHPKNSFVLVEWKDKHLLFEGKQSLELVDSQLSSLEPVVDSLEDCVKYLSSL